LYDRVEEDYKFKKVFQYFTFNWLDAYLKSDLAKILSTELVAFSSRSLVDKPVMKDSISEDAKHTNIIFRPGQKHMEEVFRYHCGLKFKSDVKNREIRPNELKALNLLKRQFSNFKQGFSTYQDFKAKSNIHK
jgi:hypothetical protein